MKEVKMKTRIVPIMLCIVFIGFIWIADASADQDYQMVCKGGGNMWLNLNFDAKFLNIEFAKSPQAGSQEPAPGTCAWLDRPINQQEPDYMTFRFGTLPRAIQIRQQNITILINDANIQDSNLRYLVDAVYNGKLFYVRCYNKEESGRHWFEITHVGP
jgi:hypothetical protein